MPHCELWPTEIETIPKDCAAVGGLNISDPKMTRVTTSADFLPIVAFDIGCTNFDEFLQEVLRKL